MKLDLELNVMEIERLSIMADKLGFASIHDLIVSKCGIDENALFKNMKPGDSFVHQSFDLSADEIKKRINLDAKIRRYSSSKGWKFYVENKGTTIIVHRIS
jgi:hypothetical protein